MRCEEFESRLNDVLDRRQSAERDADLMTHAQACGDCRASLAMWETLVDGLESRSLPDCPADMADRVVRPSGRPERSNWSLVPIGAALVIAASLLILLIPQWFQHDPPAEAPPALPGKPATLVEQRALESPHPEDQAVHSDVLVDEQYLSMLHMTGQAMATWPVAVRRASETPHVASMTEGMRPITHSVSVVIDVLRRTLPSKTHDSRS